jgi:hypothetical protein
MKTFLFTTILVACATATLSASSIVGGDGLFTQSGANQVETWLGLNNVVFTNIYTETSDTIAQFHTAVDLKGPTIALFATDRGLVGG